MDEIHLSLMKALEANPHASQRELARTLGVSLGKAHYCLRALVDKGWVKARNFRANPNKLGYMHLLTPKGVEAKAALTVDFLMRKRAEYEVLRSEIEALQRDVPSAGDSDAR